MTTHAIDKLYHYTKSGFNLQMWACLKLCPHSGLSRVRISGVSASAFPTRASRSTCTPRKH